jgi:predicted phage-related endonuclease
MSSEMIIKRVEQIKAIESFIKELEAEAETYKDEIKALMNTEAVETLQAGDYIIRWTSTLTSRFNTKKFKEDMGEAVYNAYLKQVASKRFSIA